MITVPNINWQPIANMPEDRKDGRRLLLWQDDEPFVAHWDDWRDGMWMRAVNDAENDAAPQNPQFWADINAPIELTGLT